LADVAVTLAEGIGNIIASGGSLKDLGPVLLGALGGVMIQLGTLAIQTGIGVEAIKKALQSLNGFVAIAAGVALVALGTAVRGKASSIGKSMGSGGGGSAARAATSSSRSSVGMTTAQDSNPTINFVLKGQDIWGSLQNFERNNGKTKLIMGG
jgi:hypothetical protein